jgi:hypothetical protein
MAYLNAADVKQIRLELKETFPKFKFGVRKRDGMAVSVTIKSGPTDFSSIFNQDAYNQKKQYAQINGYHMDSFYGEHAPFLKQVQQIIKTAPSRGEGYHKGDGWYDRSDAMVDYFDTAYYIDINIGSYNQPYEVK